MLSLPTAMLQFRLLRLAGYVFLAIALSFSVCEAEPRVALVIANSDYTGGIDPLANPVNDGRLISDTLSQLGFSVTFISNADQRTMKRAISDFGDALVKVGPTSSALFYYAGHGLQVAGQNYLVPINADIRREADVDLEAVPADAVLKQMEFATTGTNIVILDACRNNPLSRGIRSTERGLARVDAPNGSFIAYSTAPGDVAADGTGKNSPFAIAVAEEISISGRGIEETFRNIRVKVANATNGEQTPWDSSSLMNPFYFAGQTQQQTMNSQQTAPSEAEKAIWESIGSSDIPGDYEVYLRDFPSGAFAALARSRIELLTNTSKQTALSRAAPIETNIKIVENFKSYGEANRQKVTEALYGFLVDNGFFTPNQARVTDTEFSFAEIEPGRFAMFAKLKTQKKARTFRTAVEVEPSDNAFIITQLIYFHEIK